MKKLLIAMTIVSLMFVGCQKQNKAVETTQNVKVNQEETASEEKATEEKAPEETQETTELNPAANTVLTELTFEDYEGNTHSEAIFKDKKLTVLNIWATWCGPCVEEMPDFEKVYQEYKDKDVQFIGVAVDSDESEVKSLAKDLGITYLLVKDNERFLELVGSKFDYVPVTLFIDSEGKVLSTFVPGGTTESNLKSLIDGALGE